MTLRDQIRDFVGRVIDLAKNVSAASLACSHCNVFIVGSDSIIEYISSRLPLLDIKALNDDDGVYNRYETRLD